MFSKNNIIKHTKILLALLIFHFVLTTFIKYQLGADLHIYFLDNPIINLWKDIYLVFIYFLITIYAVKNNKLGKLKNILSISLLLIIIVSILSSILNFQGIKVIIYGFKYDIWFLFPVIFYQLLDINRKDINNFYKFFIDLLKISIVVSILFEIVRFFKPDILYILGYGPLGDWKVGAHPPLLYQTGFDGVQRMSGIFSGPNHLAFFFIAFGPLILISILNKKLHYIWGILYLILLLGSLSRSGILALGVELFILSIFIYKNYIQYRKFIKYLYITGFLVIGSIGTYLFLSGKYHQVILRGASTKGHINRAKIAVNGIKEKAILGHGLGTAGPASHYTKQEIVPESWFLQILYEIGIVGAFIWFYFIFYIIYKLQKDTKIQYPYLTSDNIFKISLCIGLIGLLVQGLVLHSFEDAMVVIPLFIIIGLIINKNILSNNYKKQGYKK